MVWQTKGKCKTEVDLFFPEDEDPDKDKKIDKAKAICATCPVRAECLEAGMREKFGVWGGKSPNERVQLRKQKRKQKRS